PHWIDFFNNQNFDGDQGKASECVRSTRERIEAVINDPSAYYLQLHSTAFDKGAVRGQLR
ncbi:MAG: CHRD domain-containing protein, partial [Actinomycetota bacterium]|nr:CHRD domain-containing protein [Actinomycetota bacterium]